MPLLPTVAAGSTGHISHTNQAWGKLNDLPNVVRDFGADPTGSVDATSIINGMISTLGNNVSVVWPTGTYKVSDGGSGYCIDMSARQGLNWIGLGNARVNPSGTGVGTTIYTTSASSKVVKYEPATQFHGGCYMENIRFEARAADTTCFSVNDVMNCRFINCVFYGNGGTTTGEGLKFAYTNDSSYHVINGCGFHGNFVGLHVVGTVYVSGCYFTTGGVNGRPIGFQSTQGAGHGGITGCKFECSTNQDAIGVQIDAGYSTRVTECGFERFGVAPAINLPNTGSSFNSHDIIANCDFDGDGTGTPMIYVGTNRLNTKILNPHFNNCESPFITDNGTYTMVVGLPGSEGGGQGRYMTMDKVAIFAGTGAPSTTGGTLQGDAPMGSLYLNKSGGASTTLYVKTGASTWTAK